MPPAAFPEMLYWLSNLHSFHQIYNGKHHEFMFPSLVAAALRMRSTLEGQNLLLEKQILSQKKWREAKKGKIEELPEAFNKINKRA